MMYADFNKETNEIVINLPPGLESFVKELNKDVISEFSYEPVNRETLIKIDIFIKEWFLRRGVELPDEE